MSRFSEASPRNAPPAHSATVIHSRQWIAMLLAGILGVFVFAGTAAGILYKDLSNKITSSVVDTSHLMQPQSAQSEEQEEKLPEDSFAGRALNILMLGTDTRVGQRGIVSPEDKDETMRADTTLVVHISADRSRVEVVSIPRDIWMLMPECNLSDGGVSPQQWGQFNWAFFFGSGGGTDTSAMAGAIACTTKTVEQITGLTMDGYAVFDFNGFGAMIEALGGVEICLDEELTDPEYLDMTFPAGCNVMDPDTATQYARVRHVGDGSDMGRIQRQQGLVSAMIKKAMSSNLFTDTASLYQFLTATLSSTVLSPSLGNINSDLGLVLSLRNIDSANVRFMTMPVLTADFNPNRMVPKEPLNTQLWQALANDTQLPEGLVYQNMEGEYFTMGADGVPAPGGNPRTDDEIGSLDGWDAERYDRYVGVSSAPTWQEPQQQNTGWEEPAQQEAQPTQETVEAPSEEVATEPGTTAVTEDPATEDTSTP